MRNDMHLSKRQTTNIIKLIIQVSQQAVSLNT